MSIVPLADRRTLGIRTQDALLRFIQRFGKGHVAAHLVFAPVADPARGEADWLDWMAEVGKPSRV